MIHSACAIAASVLTQLVAAASCNTDAGALLNVDSRDGVDSAAARLLHLFEQRTAQWRESEIQTLSTTTVHLEDTGVLAVVHRFGTVWRSQASFGATMQDETTKGNSFTRQHFGFVADDSFLTYSWAPGSPPAGRVSMDVVDHSSLAFRTLFSNVALQGWFPGVAPRLGDFAARATQILAAADATSIDDGIYARLDGTGEGFTFGTSEQ